jgi:hypothetical protein
MTETATTARLLALADRIEIQDVICAVTVHSDLDEPEQALALYLPTALIDYSSISGPQSLNVPVIEFRRRLATFLPGFDKRQHQITNFQIRVEGDTATSRAQVSAIHSIGAELWRANVTYHHRLARTEAGWRISYQRAELVYQQGQHLIAIAEQNVRARQVGG